MSLNVAIVGCGLIGKKRAQALGSVKGTALKVVSDINEECAKKIAGEFNCEFSTDWEQVVSRSDIDIVINSAINSVLELITIKALRSGKHVLCEKPLGRNVKESQKMVNAAKKGNLILKTGFNHRFHPAIWMAKELLAKGEIGKSLIIRARYGHGGRSGMEKEWRCSKQLCGGGELLDQGVHVIDLIRWFGGEITELYGKIETKFWDIEVEDNAFAVLKTNKNITVQFHVSWTNWKNIFSFEIFGDKGYLNINGLGGSYGMETLEFGKRKPEGGKPDIKLFEFPGSDDSWKKELDEFLSAIKEKREPIGSGEDGFQANKVIEALYKSSQRQVPVKLR